MKLWRGHLVISKGTSRRREEQNGEVLAFMIGDTCFAWWSNEQLRRLAERRQKKREAQDAEWSRMKGETANRT
jgi:glucose-6-phosphate dehydrogenase assembly protein OpcA